MDKSLFLCGGELFAYGRVSTREQNLDRQLLKFKEIGVKERYIFIDKASGKDFERAGYKEMKETIRKDDLLIIDSLDRLGRNYDGIIKEWNYITKERHADIIVLDNIELFDSRRFKSMGDMGKLLESQFLNMLAYVAEQERKKSKERQREGIDVAIKKGVKFGRAKIEVTDEFTEYYERWKAGTITAVHAMRELKVSKNTWYRRVKDIEQGF